MKKIVLLCIHLLFFSGLYAQVQFRELTMEEACKVAAEEGKMVFIDCTAPWCTGCKIIENELKREKEFAQLMNQLFVNIKVDVETEYGKAFAKKYQIQSLPTFFFLRSDGSLQHSFTGGSFIERFAEKFWKAINPYTCYSYLNAKYQAGERNIDLVVKYIESLQSMRKEQEAQQVKEELWNNCSIQDKINHFSLFFPTSLSEESKEMQFLLEHREQFRDEIGKNKVNKLLRKSTESLLMQIIQQDTILKTSQLKSLKKQAEHRELNARELETLFEMAQVICKKQEDKMLKICREKLNGLSEKRRYIILSHYSSLAQDTKQITAWLEVCNFYLPTMSEGALGVKGLLINVIEKLEKKLKDVQ